MDGLMNRLKTDYSILDLCWNVQPAATRQSYRFVLFDNKAGGESFVRERYVYEKDSLDQSAMLSEPILPEVSLLKIPVTQLFTNIDQKKLEYERNKKQAVLDTKMSDNQSISTSRQGKNQLGARKKRITDAYYPKDFTDLIGSDKSNRFALKWLKAWDFKVFKRKLPQKAVQESPDKTDIFFNPLKKKPKFAMDLLNQFENLSLAKEKDITELNSKMLLLSGTSGTGKTTLATVIAKKCGYHPFKVFGL